MMLRLGDHCGQYLSELAGTDDRIWVLDGDLADSDGAIHFATKHPDRFVMAGIAEQCMVSAAAGMASVGLRPWVFSFGAFLCYRAYDQIRVCISQTRQPVTLVGSHTGGLSARNGKTHATLNDVALMASLPNLDVWAPADPADIRFVVNHIMAGNRPAYLRVPRRPLGALPGEPSLCRWITSPRPVIVMSTGLGTHLALGAQEHLKRAGLEVGLVHCPRISPLPQESLLEALAGAEIIFVIEDHYTFGGLASLLKHTGTQTKVVPLGWPNDWPAQSGDDDVLLRKHGLASDQIAETIIKTLETS